MALTRAQMDREDRRAFRLRGAGRVEGVLATLTADVEHDIVGWPIGPTQGREAARRFYRPCSPIWPTARSRPAPALRRRLPGRRIVWRGRAPGRPFGLEGRGRPLSSACCTWSSSPTTATSSARTSGWISQPSCTNCRRTDMADRRRRAPNQRRRTRKDLLQAAARLMKQGRKPNLEDIAAEALVSRATAYRYFPSVEALLVEASLDWRFRSRRPVRRRRVDRSGGASAERRCGAGRDDRSPTRRRCG